MVGQRFRQIYLWNQAKFKKIQMHLLKSIYSILNARIFWKIETSKSGFELKSRNWKRIWNGSVVEVELKLKLNPKNLNCSYQLIPFDITKHFISKHENNFLNFQGTQFSWHQLLVDFSFLSILDIKVSTYVLDSIWLAH